MFVINKFYFLKKGLNFKFLFFLCIISSIKWIKVFIIFIIVDCLIFCFRIIREFML